MTTNTITALGIPAPVAAKKLDFAKDMKSWLYAESPERYELPLQELNKHVNSFRSKSVNMVLAESGFGKTNFMVSLATSQAREAKPTLFVSAEMEADTMTPRILASFFGKPIDRIEQRKKEFGTKMDEAQQRKFLAQIETYLASVPLAVTYQTCIEDILTTVIYAAEEHGVKHVFIDHFFSLDSQKPFKSDQEKEIYIIQEIDKIAKSHGICFVIATQLRKGLDYHSKANIDKDDMRGSSKIRDIATNIIYLHETEEQKKENAGIPPDVYITVTAKVLKARHGIEGRSSVLWYFRDRALFADPKTQHQEYDI